MRGAWFGKSFRACKTHKLAYANGPAFVAEGELWHTVPRAHKQNRQLPRVATAWEKRRPSAPGASRVSQHLPQKVYQAVVAVSLRNFVRALVASRAEPEPEKAQMSIDIKNGGRPHPDLESVHRPPGKA